MGPLDQIVDIEITRENVAVTQAGFGVPLLLGTTSLLTQGQVEAFSSLAGLLDFGFTTSDSIYKMALALLSQSPQVEQFLVTKLSTPVAQVNTLTPDVSVQAIQHYIVTINGVEFDFTSDATPTAAEVVTGLTALINAGTEPVTASGTTTLILTADNAGEGFALEVTANLANVATTANVGPAEDIAAAMATNPDFYGILLGTRSNPLIKGAAAFVETIKRLLFVCTADADVRSNTTPNVLDDLFDRTYDRTAFLWSGSQATYPEAGWMGRCFPAEPGSINFAFKTIAGSTTDAYTDTQRNNVFNKNGNTYESIGGRNITRKGQVVSGEYIDVIRDVDWLESRIQEDVYSLLVSNDKIPFTDKGGTLLGNVIQNRLEEAVTRGILSSYSLFVPKVADIQSADRQARFFSGITFEGVLAGAINKVGIRGTVSV